MTKEIRFFSDFLIGKEKPLTQKRTSEDNMEKLPEINISAEKTEEESKEPLSFPEFTFANDIPEEDTPISRKRAVSHRNPQKPIEEKIIEIPEKKEEDPENEPVMTRSRAVSKRAPKPIEKPVENISASENEEKILTPTRFRGKTIAIVPMKKEEKELKKKLSENYEESDSLLERKIAKERDFALLEYFLSFLKEENLNLVLAGYFEKVFTSLMGLRNKEVRGNLRIF